MLHRSFNPAKCKTALKLAVSRMKLLKNKKEALVKQQRRELAQLLESGQERTARIRVEHVVREEKAMAAYDLIEIYCELIFARMPIIESQKNCPIDLKEAIASVIFASPRCADIPELMDVRKHFTKKYGKEFVAAALEIRPDCGVSRLMVEKLSAKAPDGPAKIKILTAIAEEHNVKWDRESFEENETKPQEDLLNGPNTFGQAVKKPVESSNFQQAPDSNERVPVHSHSSNSRSPLHSLNHHSISVDASQAMPPGTSHPQPRTSGNTSESMESRHFYASGQVSSGRESWPMEFTDATTAAQAAAESAERASMAARAAAQLSSQGRITRQHSAESNKPSVSKPVDEPGQNYGKDPALDSSGSNTRLHYEKTPDDEEDELAALTERFNNLKSSINTSRTEYSKPGSDFQMADRHSRNTSSTVEKSDQLGEASVNSESESDDEFAGVSYGGVRSENVDYFEQPSFEKQASNVSSHNVFSNVSRQESSEKFSDERYRFDEENIGRNTEETNSYGNDAGLAFDDSGSEDDTYKSNVMVEDNKQDSHLYFSSTASPSLPKTPFSEESTAICSEGVASDTFPSEKGSFLPVTFDDSDDPDSDTEDELKKSEVVATNEPKTPESSHSMGSSFTETANSRSKRDTERSSPAVDSRVELHSPRNKGTEAGNQAYDTPSTFYLKSNENENFSTSGVSSSKDDIQGTRSLNTSDGYNSVEERGLVSGSGLRFGNLTGGLRNKRYKHPPYRRNALEKKTDQSLPLETNSGFEPHEQMVHKKLDEKSSSRVPFSDARNEPEEERSLKTSYSSQESYIQKGSSGFNKKPISSSYFDSDNSDSDEDLPKQTGTRKTHLSPVFSRRTKQSFPDSGKDSYTKSTDSVAEKKPSSSVSSNAAETRAKARAESKTSEYQISGSQSNTSRGSRSLEDRKSAESSKPVKESSKPSAENRKESAESSKPVKESSKPSAENRKDSAESFKPVKESSKHVAENRKVSGLRAEAPSRENSIDKASHVHPKLPDYDTLTAHLLSLRQNRE